MRQRDHLLYSTLVLTFISSPVGGMRPFILGLTSVIVSEHVTHSKGYFDAGTSHGTAPVRPARCAVSVVLPTLRRSATTARRQATLRGTALLRPCATTVGAGGEGASKNMRFLGRSLYTYGRLALRR